MTEIKRIKNKYRICNLCNEKAKYTVVFSSNSHGQEISFCKECLKEATDKMKEALNE